LKKVFEKKIASQVKKYADEQLMKEITQPTSEKKGSK
jgi:hypothetical protein